MNARKAIWMGLWSAGWLLASVAPSYAAITAVTPPEGTVGTSFTVSGMDFGDKRGKVDLGEEDCKILSWSDTAVTCEIKKAQPAGDYTITLMPQGSKKKNEPQTYAPFTMAAPQIDLGEPLRLITPLEVVTITGDFFGDKQGRVGMRDTTGLTLECRVYDWSMNSITFEIPEGLTGTCILGVKNDVGVGVQRFWATFTPVPHVAQATRTYFLKETHENATGVFFNNRFWYFMTEKDLVGDTKNEIWAGWFDSRKLILDESAPDPDGSSDAQLAPIVIDHELWLFITGEDGYLYHKKCVPGIDPETLEIDYEWEPAYHRISSFKTHPTMEIAPVWNSATGRLELFYWANNAIHRLYTDDKGRNWHGPYQVGGTGLTFLAPSAVLWNKPDGTSVTLLAIAGPTTPDTSDTFRDYTKVYALKDGVVQGARPMAWSPFPTGQPFIADMGEDYIGVVFQNVATANVDVAKLNKKTGTWQYNPLVPYIDLATKRSPSLAMNMEEKQDPNAPLGVRYDSVAYVFWGYDRGLVGTGAYMSSVELMCWWQEDGVTDTNTADTSAKADMFDLWQVVGVVDAPPFVLNGSPYAEECDLWTCNSLTFGVTQSDATTFSFDFKAGIYAETGEKSPVKLELSASLVGNYSHTETKTFDVTTTLFRSKEGLVSVFYIAPKFRSHHIQWYDLTGSPSGNFLEYVQMLDAQLLSQEFDPRGFPWTDLHGMPPTYFDLTKFRTHASADETATGDWARLNSYSASPPPEFEPWFWNALYWNRGAEKHLKWVLSEETTNYIGSEIKLKIGVNIGKYFGFGVQGEVSYGWGTRVTVDNHSELALIPGSSLGTPFHSYRVDAYWLKPDPNGYWVPLNRRENGDAPWFITYQVSDVAIVQ